MSDFKTLYDVIHEPKKALSSEVNLPELSELTKPAALSSEVSSLSSEVNLPELSELTKPAALSSAKLNGSKGGKARATRLTPERRREIAMAGVKARKKKKQEKENFQIGFSPFTNGHFG